MKGAPGAPRQARTREPRPSSSSRPAGPTIPHAPTWPGMETFGGADPAFERLSQSGPFRRETRAGRRLWQFGRRDRARPRRSRHRCNALRSAARSMSSRASCSDVPILVFPVTEQWLPSRVADAINAPLLRFAIGSIEKLGLKRSPKGPLQSIEEDGRVPLIDIGTLDAIRDGRIKLRGDVASFAGESVAFRQSPAERFDAIILATGFRPDLRPLLPDAKGVLNATGAPLVSGRATAEPGLFFCGAIPSALGQFRQIGIEAQRIADAAQALRAALSSPVSRPDEALRPRPEPSRSPDPSAARRTSPRCRPPRG